MPAKTAQAGIYSEAAAYDTFAAAFLFVLSFSFQGTLRMRYWLIKSDPDEVSFADVLAAPGRTVAWFGVRNYQARNFMRDQMQVGDGVLFYHSSCAVPGVAGIAQVASGAYPDASQFEPGSHYFDPKATREQPRWISVDVTAVAEGRYLPLADMRGVPELEDMVLLQKGSRLSISPVTKGQWDKVLELMGVA